MGQYLAQIKIQIFQQIGCVDAALVGKLNKNQMIFTLSGQNLGTMFGIVDGS